MNKQSLSIILAGLFFSLILSSCTGRRTTDKPTTANDTIVQTSFPFPDIPQVIVNPDERAEYLLLHYWDNFNFDDTLLLKNTAVTEQGIVDYLSLMVEYPAPTTIRESFSNLCARFGTHAEAVKEITSLMGKYLYDTNSPQHNEALFDLFLQCLTEQPAVQGNAAFSRWQFLQKLIRQNRPGSPANNFTCYTPDGRQHTLYNLAKGPNTLLFFYDPECSNCQQALLEMKGCHDLDTAIDQGIVTVVAVYTEADEDTWQNSLGEMPDKWHVVTDRGGITEKALYDLKAMPSMYLLDADKKVVLKDATFADVCRQMGFRPV